MGHLTTLDNTRAGDVLRVVSILDPETATMALRLGIAEGETITVASKVPGGPLVVCRGKVDIALGRALCKGIQVQIQDKRVTVS